MLTKAHKEVLPSFPWGLSSHNYSQIHSALQQIPPPPPPQHTHTALLNFACDWLALDRDTLFGRLTSPKVWRYITIER